MKDYKKTSEMWCDRYHDIFARLKEMTEDRNHWRAMALGCMTSMARESPGGPISAQLLSIVAKAKGET